MTLVMEWATRAACRWYDPEWWFPEPSRGAARAVAICEQCPVQPDCLDYAVNDPSLDGVWGGYTARQRRAFRPQRVPTKTCVQCGQRREMAGRYCSRDCRVAATCGTPAGYRQHRAHGEDACRPCRAAHTADGAENRRRRRQRQGQAAAAGYSDRSPQPRGGRGAAGDRREVAA